MISEAMRQFIENTPLVYVASADAKGHPHVAAGKHLTVSDGTLLVFENWFCPVTLHNIARNAHVAVVVAAPGAKNGYQLIGRVVKPHDDPRLPGENAGPVPLEAPPALTRFVVRVEEIMEFSTGIHFDIPINPGYPLPERLG
ncbi:pyridoxamine 5'-phosphate oxidase family protein [Geobacter sp. FeAm09]|uniref:pyridoxamine 5'-phosphate oxidase family protein n=1 Tax=Geobacter sp. FeAm09 TaxID=2597769 RepID=UPI0011ECED3C|nr:pyridoxamine 5'-phosphate oxidase family protein [Geobacter sp. FeAm09]QEM68824.1 pyridoxamine 5'-phosphate oxidase family protein [Geobacter sp. FeAm09]